MDRPWCDGVSPSQWELLGLAGAFEGHASSSCLRGTSEASKVVGVEELYGRSASTSWIPGVEKCLIFRVCLCVFLFFLFFDLQACQGRWCTVVA